MSVLCVVALVVLGFVALKYGGSSNKQVSTTEPSAGANQPQTSTVIPSVTMAEAQKEFKAIQDQVNAGTLSPEEAAKQMNALGPKILPPPLPAGAKIKK